MEDAQFVDLEPVGDARHKQLHSCTLAARIEQRRERESRGQPGRPASELPLPLACVLADLRSPGNSSATGERPPAKSSLVALRLHASIHHLRLLRNCLPLRRRGIAPRLRTARSTAAEQEEGSIKPRLRRHGARGDRASITGRGGCIGGGGALGEAVSCGGVGFLYAEHQRQL